MDKIKNYCRTASAIIKTVEIQKELDDVYLEAEKRNGVQLQFNKDFFNNLLNYFCSHISQLDSQKFS